ncbi:MAG: YggS family pyridoxal phosphate-dependent enzyme [Candidatus Methylomirabilales bacterium]
MTLKERLEEVKRRMAEAALRAGRDPGEVQLVAVSKTVPIPGIREAIEAGVTILGENRVQEAKAKIAELAGLAHWHLVGHLQTNKAKLAVQLFDLIHSLDSLRLARELDKFGKVFGKPVEVLVQVKLSEEETKSGLPEGEVLPLLKALADLPSISVKGLMVFPPYFPDPEAVRPYFRRLRELRDQLREEALPENVKLDHLSMGMSHDFEVAIEEGATLVRIGTAIFGPRG